MATSLLQISSIEQSLTQMQSRYNKASGALEMLRDERTGKAAGLDAAKNDIAVWEQCQALLGKVGEFAREQLKVKIQATVTAALQAVFEDDSMEFKVVMGTVNGKPTANWVAESRFGDTVVAAEPESAKGGGVCDVISLALRLSLLELSRPVPGGPVILDESSKHVSASYAPNVAQFLKQYAQQTDRQILLVTHQDALADVADVTYQVTQKDGKSEVRRL